MFCHSKEKLSFAYVSLGRFKCNVSFCGFRERARNNLLKHVPGKWILNLVDLLNC